MLVKTVRRPGERGTQRLLERFGLREQVKAGGGRWSTTEMLWWVLPEEVKRLGLESRVVKR